MLNFLRNQLGDHSAAGNAAIGSSSGSEEVSRSKPSATLRTVSVERIYNRVSPTPLYATTMEACGSSSSTNDNHTVAAASAGAAQKSHTTSAATGAATTAKEMVAWRTPPRREANKTMNEGGAARAGTNNDETHSSTASASSPLTALLWAAASGAAASLSSQTPLTRSAVSEFQAAMKKVFNHSQFLDGQVNRFLLDFDDPFTKRFVSDQEDSTMTHAARVMVALDKEQLVACNQALKSHLEGINSKLRDAIQQCKAQLNAVEKTRAVRVANRRAATDAYRLQRQKIKKHVRLTLKNDRELVRSAAKDLVEKVKARDLEDKTLLFKEEAKAHRKLFEQHDRTRSRKKSQDESGHSSCGKAGQLTTGTGAVAAEVKKQEKGRELERRPMKKGKGAKDTKSSSESDNVTDMKEVDAGMSTAMSGKNREPAPANESDDEGSDYEDDVEAILVNDGEGEASGENVDYEDDDPSDDGDDNGNDES